jgi:hypothetical protein
MKQAVIQSPQNSPTTVGTNFFGNGKKTEREAPMIVSQQSKKRRHRAWSFNHSSSSMLFQSFFYLATSLDEVILSFRRHCWLGLGEPPSVVTLTHQCCVAHTPVTVRCVKVSGRSVAIAGSLSIDVSAMPKETLRCFLSTFAKQTRSYQ